MKEDNQAIWTGTKALTIAGIVVIALGLLGTVSYGYTHAWTNDIETRALEHSYTFVSTKKELLTKLAQDCAKIEAQEALHKGEPDVVQALEAQRRATVDRLRSEAAMIAPREVPADAQRYL